MIILSVRCLIVIKKDWFLQALDFNLECQSPGEDKNIASQDRMCNGFTAMGIFMENLCYYRDCKSSSLCCYRICKRGIQFHTYLDPDCYRICMLLGCFYCASTYSSTSALTVPSCVCLCIRL
jgi:hypothetical protein